MEFAEFKQKLQKHFESMAQDQNFLFAVEVDKDVLWNTYLDSFEPGTNEIFRERREFDCSCCRHFIKSFGNVVTILDNKLVTIWDFDVDGSKFEQVVKALSGFVKVALVSDVFVTKESAFGTDKNHEMREDGTAHTWEHFRIDLPKRFVSTSHLSESAQMAAYRDSRNVFKRSLEELSKDSIDTVLDLIDEQSLYKGDEWQAVLNQLRDLQTEYQALPENEKENYCWIKSVGLGGAISRIRNHSIGVLLQDITSGMDVLEAVRRYEAIVAPTNYKRPKAIFTTKMVEQAQETVMRLGLLDSLGRRYAILPDITVNNVLWANRDATKHMDGVGGVFEMLKQDVTENPRAYERAQAVGIEEFISSVLPTATSIEVLVENRHESSLVSLVAPKVADSPTLFKWDNAFSWAYNGNVADSMKQRVKSAGGNVDGVLRFSLQWNDGFDNRNDYDAHCKEPSGNHIWFENKGRRHASTGMLDVDIIHPGSHEVAVENITWTNISKMQDGVYIFYVHNYSHRGGRSGFDAEIEFAGQIFEFAYHNNLAQGEIIVIAKVKLENGQFKIIESLPTTTSTRSVWGLQTNRFHPVSVCMYSPNYWDGQKGIGHKHYFMMLAGCENDTHPNGFFNEYLREEFMEHKRVLEALGSKMKVEESKNQLSGLGFSSTKRDSLVAKVNGKPIKIVF